MAWTYDQAGITYDEAGLTYDGGTGPTPPVASQVVPLFGKFFRKKPKPKLTNRQRDYEALLAILADED